MNETRQKGNLTGGVIPYGYKNENKKAVIVPEHAEIVRHIYEQYSIGAFVKDIIASLTSKGILYYGKPFVRNTVYKILKNERYSGLYKHNGESFDNIYPQIVPQEIFDKVRNKVNSNRYGKQSIEVVYLLRHKLKCGYCGQPISAESGTARGGEKKHYYKCRARKNGSDCKKSVIRKDLLENMIMENIIQALSDKKKMNDIVKNLMSVQEKQSQANTVLNLLQKEKRQADNSINNIMTAIEQGGSTNTTIKRLRELEQQQENLERQILIEKSKTSVLLTEKDISEFYEQALQLEPKMLITYLIKEIVLYDDKIEIFYNSPIHTSPDENRGFSFYLKTIDFSYKIPQRQDLKNYNIAIEMIIN